MSICWSGPVIQQQDHAASFELQSPDIRAERKLQRKCLQVQLYEIIKFIAKVQCLLCFYTLPPFLILIFLHLCCSSVPSGPLQGSSTSSGLSLPSLCSKYQYDPHTSEEHRPWRVVPVKQLPVLRLYAASLQNIIASAVPECNRSLSLPSIRADFHVCIRNLASTECSHLVSGDTQHSKGLFG